jgi:DNA polymerase-1
MLVKTSKDFGTALEIIGCCDLIAMDTETDGLNPYKGNKIVGVSLFGNGQSFYMPFRHGTGENLPEPWIDGIVTAMHSRYQDSKTTVWWNAPFDLKMFTREGYQIPLENHVEDAMLAAHLLNENEPNFQLKSTADRYSIGVGSKDEEDLKVHVFNMVKGLVKTSTSWKGHMWKLDPELVAPYAETDAVLTYELRQFYMPHLETWKLLDLYKEVCDYMLLVTRMEHRGLLLDVDLIHQYREEAKEKEKETLLHFKRATGNPVFNPGSPKQLMRQFGWPTSREDYLSQLPNDENAKMVLTYRGFAKVNTTYYDVYLNLRDNQNILRPNYRLNGTISGRLSCENPNLTAVPRRTEVYKVKDVIIPRPGYIFLEMDLSQAELRIASFYAHEDVMGEILARGGDLHREVSESLTIPRDTAKRINFSSVYGIGAPTFASKYHMEVELARMYLTRWHNKFKGFKRFYYNMSDLAERQGYIRLDSGRIRRYKINGHTIAEYHKASSNKIQGTVAEVMRIAMVNIDRALRGYDVHQLLTVHDQTLLEVPIDIVDKVIPEVAYHLTNFNFDPPLTVDAKVGSSWGQAKHVEIPRWSYWRPSKFLSGEISPEPPKERLLCRT